MLNYSTLQELLNDLKDVYSTLTNLVTLCEETDRGEESLEGIQYA
jgi:hypothetical protein